MSRTIKNGTPEKYDKVTKYRGGNLTNEDKFAKIRESRAKVKKERQAHRNEIRITMLQNSF